MSKIVMINGVLHAPEEAKVSVFDRGFLYGDSVFETVRTYGGRPFALEAHLERLEKSARLVAIELPWGRARLAEDVARAVAAADNTESYVRIMVTRGTGALGLDPGLAKDPLCVIIVARLEPPPRSAYESGVKAVTYRTQRATDDTPAVGAKVGNYLVSALAMGAARQAGAAEALIVDGHGNVVEGSTSNVFVVRQGRVITPPEDAGILPGITRAHVLQVCQEVGITVELAALPVAEVQKADEVFVSSSIRELLPVVAVDGVPIGAGRPGPLTRRLHAAFKQKVRDLM